MLLSTYMLSLEFGNTGWVRPQGAESALSCHTRVLGIEGQYEPTRKLELEFYRAGQGWVRGWL